MSEDETLTGSGWFPESPSESGRFGLHPRLDSTALRKTSELAGVTLTVSCRAHQPPALVGVVLGYGSDAKLVTTVFDDGIGLGRAISFPATCPRCAGGRTLSSSALLEAVERLRSARKKMRDVDADTLVIVADQEA